MSDLDKSVTVALSRSQKSELQQIAGRRGKSMSEYVRVLIARDLKYSREVEDTNLLLDRCMLKALCGVVVEALNEESEENLPLPCYVFPFSVCNE